MQVIAQHHIDDRNAGQEVRCRSASACRCAGRRSRSTRSSHGPRRSSSDGSGPNDARRFDRATSPGFTPLARVSNTGRVSEVEQDLELAIYTPANNVLQARDVAGRRLGRAEFLAEFAEVVDDFGAVWFPHDAVLLSLETVHHCCERGRASRVMGAQVLGPTCQSTNLGTKVSSFCGVRASSPSGRLWAQVFHIDRRIKRHAADATSRA